MINRGASREAFPFFAGYAESVPYSVDSRFTVDSNLWLSGGPDQQQ